MKKSKITTAAFLAGATTLAVSLPAMASERAYEMNGFGNISAVSSIDVWENDDLPTLDALAAGAATYEA